MVMLFFLLPDYINSTIHTFNGIGLDQLRAIFKQSFRNRSPFHPFRHTQIYMG